MLKFRNNTVVFAAAVNKLQLSTQLYACRTVVCSGLYRKASKNSHFSALACIVIEISTTLPELNWWWELAEIFFFRPSAKEGIKDNHNISGHIKLYYWQIIHKLSKIWSNYSAEKCSPNVFGLNNCWRLSSFQTFQTV